jgi:hypothetical protein
LAGPSLPATQPVAIGELFKQLVSGVIKLLIIFGVLAWSGEQVATVLLVVDLALAFAAGVWVYLKVTPTAAPKLPAATAVTVQETGETVLLPDA